ncbi:MAG: FGGY-family carbohydrate kinase [Pseudomonadota bacterium]
MTLSLGIDVGTSGIRSAVVDETGKVLSMARAAHVPQTGDTIHAEPWWHAVKSCLLEQVHTLRALGRDPGEISALAVDGTSGSMVLVDENLKPVTRALMYNSKGFDEEAARIAAVAPDVHITRGSGSALGRAMRLASEDREKRAKHLLHQADFIAAKLTGRAGLTDHNNALKTGFDPESGAWPDWVDQVLDAQLLPQARPVGAAFAPVLPSLRAEFGFQDNATVYAGTTDSIAAFLAAAPAVEGNAVTSIGSTLAVKVLSKQRIDDPAIGLYSHKVGDSWLVGGASNTGGAVLAKYFSVNEIVALSDQMDPLTPIGLDYYPMLRPGERFPINDPNLQPRLTPRPDSDAEFLQGMFEGIAAIEATCYKEITARGGKTPTQVFTAGGAAQNPKLTQIRAMALGLPLATARHEEAAVGAAMCCRIGR